MWSGYTTNYGKIGYKFLLFLLATLLFPSTLALPKHRKNNSILTRLQEKPPDHLKAVRIERDGHINPTYTREIILGHQGLTEEQLNSPNILLKRIFQKVDKDNDTLLSEEELTSWIKQKTQEHLDQAIRENVHVFLALDKNHNGVVSWSEYHYRFMLEHGFSEEFIKNHPETHKGLSRHVREEILLDRKAWTDAARSDPDSLNIDEFLSFRHPEHSMSSLFVVIQDLFERMDEDGDQVLTVEEFSAVPVEGIPAHLKQSNKDWLTNRSKEFKQIIDVDHNDKVTKQELLMYANPRNPAHASREARKLIALADKNADGKLSIKEVLAEKDLFLGSKMIDTARSFHDEF